MTFADAILKRAARRALPHPIYRVIRKRRVQRIINRYEPQFHVGSYGGHILKLRFEDPLAEGWYGHDWPALPEIQQLRAHGRLRSGARVFDLGAHQGLVALIFAREVGTDGHVLAVEAEPHNAAVAEINRGLNGANNITVVNAAVAGATGTLHFAVGLNGMVDEMTAFGNVEVRAVTIDSLAERFGMPDIVFVDIEGYEGRAPRAAEAVIAHGAAFFVEVHVGQLVGLTATEVVERFAERKCYIAVNPGGTTTYKFVPYTGIVPRDRFYLLAI